MDFTYTIFCLFLILQVVIAQKYVAVLVNHNEKSLNLPKNHRTVNIRNNLHNILRSTKCQKIGNKCSRGLKSKIVGGFQVDMMSKYAYHARYGAACGASIIGEAWAITAAHCGHKPYVMAGSKYRDDGKTYSIDKFIFHPEWHSPVKKHRFDYDFLILRLKERFDISENVKPIQIATLDDLKVGTFVTVTGWGHTKFNGQRANVLKAVEVPIVDKEDCQNVKFPMFKNTLTPRMFCAGFFEGEKDACQGDSGGAAVANGRLVGLVSFGYGCATPEAYGVYSNVVAVRNWVIGVIDSD